MDNDTGVIKRLIGTFPGHPCIVGSSARLYTHVALSPILVFSTFWVRHLRLYNAQLCTNLLPFALLPYHCCCSSFSGFKTKQQAVEIPYASSNGLRHANSFFGFMGASNAYRVVCFSSLVPFTLLSFRRRFVLPVC